MPKAGEIWLAEIPFTSGVASKLRPVLVLWEDAADVVPVCLALNIVLFELTVFEQRAPPFEFLAVDDELVAGLAGSQSNHAFDTFGHGNEFGVKFTEHGGN